MRKLKSVLIGCGAIAREHLSALAELRAVEVMAVCDLSPARAEAAAERFGIAKWYTRYEEMLADIQPDLVHITTPPSSHFSIAQSCLVAGLNVLCEKPITVVYSEFCVLKKLASTNGCVLIENQHNRFHSAIKRIWQLVRSGDFGDIIGSQICISLNIFAPDGPYVDKNAPHFSLALRGGVIGDFLPHIAYLAYMFTWPVINVRTVWATHIKDSPLPADEFRGIIKGERANAYVSFSGNAQPNAFLVRVTGTRMRVEANLYEGSRLRIRRFRQGEPALVGLVDGIVESRDVLWGAVAGFFEKLAGTSSYNGLLEFFTHTYRALERSELPPVPLEEIDAIARLVDDLTNADFRL
jgi:predicted dehydrogenase